MDYLCEFGEKVIDWRVNVEEAVAVTSQAGPGTAQAGNKNENIKLYRLTRNRINTKYSGKLNDTCFNFACKAVFPLAVSFAFFDPNLLHLTLFVNLIMLLHHHFPSVGQLRLFLNYI